MKRKCNKMRKKIQKAQRIIKKTKIWWCAVAAILASCGTTKVTVSQPTEGSYTTITVTTNNPITTTPTTDTNFKIK